MSQIEDQKCIESCGFKIDSEKNLFIKTGNDFVLVQKLKKDIYKMVQFENSTFFIDTFGDCFIMKTVPVFLFGILSTPTYFNVLNNRIYSIDKYSRVWIHDIEGEILNISFLKENIKTVIIKNDYCSITTDGQASVVDYSNVQSESIEKFLMIYNRSFELIKRQNIEKVLNI